jgi:hypothetical protein
MQIHVPSFIGGILFSGLVMYVFDWLFDKYLEGKGEEEEADK